MSARLINLSRYVLIAMTVLCLVFCTLQGTKNIVANAASNEEAFDKTDVLVDLKSSSINGKPFDLREYPYDANQDMKLLNFVEFAYSFVGNQNNDYSLYVYVYNPKGINIGTTTKQNKIQMAVQYNDDGTPTRYEKFNLVFCSKSTGDYNNLFYKFRIEDRKLSDGTTFYNRVNSNERRYDISGIELLTYGNPNATEYTVGGTYKFTGYVAGYGPDPNASSTLNCTVEDFETLYLDVHKTNYRTNVSHLGEGHYNEVHTVYFAVPERIFEEYGNLQKIRAEWWEYKTQYAAITSNYEYYQSLAANVGKYAENSDIRMWYGKSSYTDRIDTGLSTITNTTTTYDWAYGISSSQTSGTWGSNTIIVEERTDILPYAFYSTAESVGGIYDFLYTESVAGDVESSTIKNWMYNYSNDLGNGYIDCNGRTISKDLFMNHVDEGRTMGYNDRTIDLADTFDLLSYDSNHTWWDKLWDYGMSWPETDGDLKDVKPIVEVRSTDLLTSNQEISDNLLININDVGELKTFYAEESAKGNRVILFRFANTDYFSHEVGRRELNEQNADTYIASQTVFFDFDIIELTFNKDGVYHVIPVVSSPQDIVNDFTAPATEMEWWKIVLAVVLLILLIVLIAPAIPYIIQGVIWLVKLPIKCVKAIAKSIKKE